jgi:acyl-CoA synthetase (AMP-forming)/AMP-acid ligase II
LFISGRLKTVLIIGGRKIQAEEIEATLAEPQTALRPALVVALSADIQEREQLVIVKEVPTRSLQKSTAELEALAKSIRARVADAHQVPVSAVVLTRPGGVPTTSSGKVQRAACRDAFLRHQLQPVYEWTAPEPNRRM